MSSYNRSFYGKLLFRRWSTLNPMETNQIGLLGRVAKILLKKLNSTPNALHFRSDFAQRSPTLARPFLARSSFVFVCFFFLFRRRWALAAWAARPSGHAHFISHRLLIGRLRLAKRNVTANAKIMEPTDWLQVFFLAATNREPLFAATSSLERPSGGFGWKFLTVFFLSWFLFYFF